MTKLRQTYAIAILLCGTVLPALAADDGTQSVPDFSSATAAWLAQGTDFKLMPGSPAQVENDSAHPHVGNGQGAQSSFRFAGLDNPNLTEFAKAGLKKTNDEVLHGKAMFSREARCWPTGVPTYDLNQAQPVYFIQTPKEVVMVWQMDHQVRHIYLDVPHSANPKPSWYGESVGHYEGDTLVIDTIGQNTDSFVDNYRTPHSTALHVTERFRLVNDGKNMRADIVVEDPATYKEPVHIYQTWRHVTPGAMAESSCAESGPGFFDFDVEPIPTAAKPEF